MLLDTLKHTAAVVTTFTAGLAPAVTEAAPAPRGGVCVVRHQPGPRPVFQQHRPVIHMPSVHHQGPRPMPGRGPVIHQPSPRPGHVTGRWQPAPPPPRYDQREARRDRRIARGVAAVTILAALFGGRQGNSGCGRISCNRFILYGFKDIIVPLFLQLLERAVNIIRYFR